MLATLYLAAFQKAMQVKSHGTNPAACVDTSGSLLEPDAGATMLKCQLASAKYHASFLYQNGLPRIAEAVVKSLDPNIGKMREDVREAATVILNELVLA